MHARVASHFLSLTLTLTLTLTFFNLISTLPPSHLNCLQLIALVCCGFFFAIAVNEFEHIGLEPLPISRSCDGILCRHDIFKRLRLENGKVKLIPGQALKLSDFH